MTQDFVKYDFFEKELAKMYAAHGKNYPANSIIAAIWARVKELPDDFLAWACKEIADYEKFPGNPGREFARILWPDYKAKNAEKFIAAGQTCQDCRGETEGIGFYAFKPEPTFKASPWRAVFCPCRCNVHEPMRPHVTTKAQMRAMGWDVCPQGGYPGGHLVYLRSKHIHSQ